MLGDPLALQMSRKSLRTPWNPVGAVLYTGPETYGASQFHLSARHDRRSNNRHIAAMAEQLAEVWCSTQTRHEPHA